MYSVFILCLKVKIAFFTNRAFKSHTFKRNSKGYNLVKMYITGNKKLVVIVKFVIIYSVNLFQPHLYQRKEK